MNDLVSSTDMQAVYERLTRLEERGVAREQRMERMERSIEQLVSRVEAIGQDVRDAKTGLRVGLWISNTLWPIIAAGSAWAAHHFWPGK